MLLGKEGVRTSRDSGNRPAITPRKPLSHKDLRKSPAREHRGSRLCAHKGPGKSKRGSYRYSYSLTSRSSRLPVFGAISSGDPSPDRISPRTQSYVISGSCTSFAVSVVAVHSAQRKAGAKLDAFWGIDVVGLGGLRSRQNSCLRTTAETAYGAWWRFRDIEIAVGCTSV